MGQLLVGSWLVIVPVLVAAVAGIPARGAVIAAYDAHQTASPPHPVTAAGWMEAFTSPAFGSLAYPVENDLGTGLGAWQIADQSPAPNNPVYFQNLNDSHVQDGMQRGWRFSMRGRYVFDFSDGPNLGLTASINGRRYSLMLDLSPAGALSATLNDAIPRTHVLTPAGVGPLAYHDYSIIYAPADSTASFYFDGLLIDEWMGTIDELGNTILWGNPSGATQRGVINFNQIVFETDPQIVGDYNQDKKVDDLDYKAWRETIGHIGPSPADGNGNHVVDAADYVVWRSHTQRLMPASAQGEYEKYQSIARVSSETSLGSDVKAITSIPEPTVLAYLWLGVLTAIASQLRTYRDVSRPINRWS